MAAIDVTNVFYEPLDPTPDLPYVMRVYLVGAGFQLRAVPVVAEIGDQPLEGLVHDDTLGSAAGFLRTLPPAGASLKVGYLDIGLEETTFTFPSLPTT